MFRSRCIEIAILLLLIGCPCFSLEAQDELELFIDHDTVAFIAIKDPEAILQQIEFSAFSKNRHFQKAFELMVEGEFPLVDREKLIELENKWYELRRCWGNLLKSA